MDVAPSAPHHRAASATRKTLGLMAGSALGKAVGFARDVTLAYFFGTTGVADAFRVSIAAALVPTHFFMGDVLDSAFVPLYVRYRTTNVGSARRLLRLTGAYLLSVSLGLAVIIWFAGVWFIRLVAPGLAPESLETAVRMVRWVGLGIPFYSIAALFGLYGVCTNRFRPVAVRPAFQNAGLTLVIPLAAWLADPQWVGLGFTATFLLYFVYVVWELKPLEGFRAASGTSQGGELPLLFRTASPLVAMMVLGQLLAIVSRAAASYVGVGAIASLEYARVFVEMPQAVIGTAIATTLLARFSALEGEALADRAARLIPAVLAGTLGLMLVLAAVAPELVTVAFRRGRFDAEAVASVTLAVRGLAPSGAFMTASYVMNRVLSAQLRNRESILPMAATVFAAIVLNVVLAPRFGVYGVGLALSAAYLLLCCTLAVRLRITRVLLKRTPGWLFAAALASALALGLRPIVDSHIVRFGVLTLVVASAWLGGLSLFRVNRDDLGFLVDHILRAWRNPKSRSENHAG